ncbi:MAG: 50S ribosomal protein L23 [Nitrospinota bacterium]
MSSIDNFDVIRSPLLTEKATDLRDHRGQICFKVDTRANKKQITEAVEKIFDVKVVGVRTVNTKAKPRSLGKHSGYKPGYKKAIISLKEGDTIDIFEKVT